MPTTLLLIFLVLLAAAGGEWLLRQRAAAASGDWETRPLPEPDLKATRIVVLGDSIAYGSDLPAAAAWPSLLAERLQRRYPGRRWQVINAGVSGHTSADAYVRFHEHVSRYEPHLVLIALGLNDLRQVRRSHDARRRALFARNERTWWGKSYLARALSYRLLPLPTPTPAMEDQPAGEARVSADEFTAILTWLLRQTQRLGAQPVLLTLAPLSPGLNGARRAEFARWSQYNALLRETARNLNVPFIELSHRFTVDQPWLADGVHLSAEGEAAVAERVWQGLHRPTIAPALQLSTQESNAEMAPTLE